MKTFASAEIDGGESIDFFDLVVFFFFLADDVLIFLFFLCLPFQTC